MYETTSSSSAPLFGAFAGLFIAIAAVCYLFFAYAQYRIAKKCGCDDHAWWGFIPILNLFLWAECARREWYWGIFLLVPFVNIIVWLITAVDIARHVGQNPVWGVLTILPFINFVAFGVLAFTAPVARSGFDSTPSRRQPVGV